MPATPRGKKQRGRKSKEIVLSGNNFSIPRLQVRSDGSSFHEPSRRASSGDTPPATEPEFQHTFFKSASATPQTQLSTSSSVDSRSKSAFPQDRSPNRARKRRLEKAGYDTSDTTILPQNEANSKSTKTRTNIVEDGQDASNWVSTSLGHPKEHLEEEELATEEPQPIHESPSVSRQRRIGGPKAASEQENIPLGLDSDLTNDSSDIAAQLTSRESHTNLDTMNSGPGPAPFRNASGVPLQQNPQARNSQVNAPRLTNGKLGMLHSLALNWVARPLMVDRERV